MSYADSARSETALTSYELGVGTLTKGMRPIYPKLSLLHEELLQSFNQLNRRQVKA